MESSGKVKTIQKFVLDPAIFLVVFGWALSSQLVTNQILRQTCLFTYGYSDVICAHLDDKNSSKLVEQEIQPYVASVLMTITVLNSVIPATMSLFLGQWSDDYGRKKVINGLFFGFTVSLAWITIVSFVSEGIAPISPWNYVFAQLPFMLGGGMPTLINIVLCYCTDQTTEENRSTRLTIFEIIVFIGALIAVASSSFILEAIGPTAVFSISFVCCVLGSFIAVFFVKESVKVRKEIGLVNQYKDLFTLARVKKLFEIVTRKRTNKRGRILVLLMIILLLTNFTSTGSQTVFYLFMRQKMGWNLQDWTIYEAFSMLLTVFGAILGIVVLKRWFKLEDLSLSMITMGTLVLDALIKTVATRSWQFYLASLVGILKLLSGPMLRSIMSTVVFEGEISRIYSITSTIEAISGLGSAPLYSNTYSATLTTFPGAFNLITAGIFAVSVVLAVFVARWMQSTSNDKTIDTRL